jgi:hypothetical protein
MSIALGFEKRVLAALLQPKKASQIVAEAGLSRLVVTASLRSLEIKKKVSKNDAGWYFAL